MINSDFSIYTEFKENENELLFCGIVFEPSFLSLSFLWILIIMILWNIYVFFKILHFNNKKWVKVEKKTQL